MTEANCVLNHGADENGNPRHASAYEGRLCRKHRERLDDTTAEVSALWCELNLVIGGALPREATEKTRHLKASEAPAPLDLTAVSLRDPRTVNQRIRGKWIRSGSGMLFVDPDDSEPIPAVPHIVASWLMLLAEERPIEMWRWETRLRIRRNRATGFTRVPVPIKLPEGVVAQLALLARHHSWIAGRDWVDDYVLEMGELRKALKSAVRDQGEMKSVGKCPSLNGDGLMCGGKLWPDQSGEMRVRCGKCLRVYGETYLRHLGGMLTEPKLSDPDGSVSV